MDPKIGRAEDSKHVDSGHSLKRFIRERLEGAVTILKPVVLGLNIEGHKSQVLMQVDSVIRELLHQEDYFEQPSKLKTLTNTEEVVDQLISLCARVSRSISWGSAENVVRFLAFALRILQDIYIDAYVGKAELMDRFFSLKKEIVGIHDELQFLKYFLRIVWNPLIEDHEDVMFLFFSAQRVAMGFSSMFCYYCLCVMNDNMDDNGHGSVSFLKEDVLPVLVEEIRSLHLIVRGFYDISKSSVIHENIDVTLNRPTNILDEHVVDFFGLLIDKLTLCLPGDDNEAAADSEDAAAAVSTVKNQIGTLVDDLIFLRCNLLDVLLLYPKEEDSIDEMIYLTVSTQALIVETGHLVYFSRIHEEEEDHIRRENYWSFHLPNLLEAVDSLKQQACDAYSSNESFSRKLTACPSSSPNLMEFVHSLIEILEVLMRHDVASIRHPGETLYEEMVSMREYLISEIAEDQLGNSPIEFLVEQFKEAACQAKFIIDSFLAGNGSLWYNMLGIFVVTNDIKMTYKEMKAILKKMKTSDTKVNSISSHFASSLMANYPPTDVNISVSSQNEMKNTKFIETANKLVGVKDTATKVIELVSQGPSQLKILSIVGMPGLGKTTLANSVFEHPSISILFHVRAWYCVSQVYDRQTLLTEILSQIVGENMPSHGEVTEEDCAVKLYRNLKGRKYLIAIDDIWDVEVWNYLKRIFPDDGNGSRILFTTRHRRVALKVNSILYELSLLSNKQSCELLWSKVFDGETCPPELSIVSKRVARNCGGLPLAVVLMAGILKMTKRNKDSWEKVAATVTGLQATHRNHLGTMEFTSILEISYKHLPDWLKPCFLYFGSLPEGTSISVSKLIRIWISDGFVQEVNLIQKSLEEEAKSYLDELIDRSLVMISRRSSKGGVKACRVHNIVRAFCSKRIQEERYILRLHNFGGLLCIHGDHEKQICSLSYHYRSDGATGELNFPAVSNDWPSGLVEGLPERAASIDSVPAGRRVHSVMHKPPTGRKDVSTTDRRSTSTMLVSITKSRKPGQLDYGFILQYKLLTVLDLGSVGVESSADTSDLIELSKLVNLRYLAICPRTNEIPTEMGDLRHLETFTLTGAIGYIIIPESFWNVKSMTNVLMDHGFFNFQQCSKIFFENFQMDNLKSISTLSLQHGDDVENFILSRIPSIQKLACRFSAYSWDNARGCSVFPVFEFLNELESLKVVFAGKVRCPCKFSFPSNLKKLSLSNSRLPWDEISVIGRQLRNLEVLKLLNKAFEGRHWDMGGDEFQKLKFLKLDTLNIEVWNAYAEHLPCLEQLVVQSCVQLEEIPSSFGEISTLQLIEMKWCSSSAEVSVKQILEIQRDLSNDQLKVTIVSSAIGAEPPLGRGGLAAPVVVAGAGVS